MLSEEIKQLLELSDGKIVISDGSVKKSYVIMKLSQYIGDLEKKIPGNYPLAREEIIIEKFSENSEDNRRKRNLTDMELLDKINSDIEELRQRKMEKDIENIFEEKMQEEDDYDYDYI